MKTSQGLIDALLKNHEESQRNTKVLIKNLETQIGQTSSQLTNIENSRREI